MAVVFELGLKGARGDVYADAVRVQEHEAADALLGEVAWRVQDDRLALGGAVDLVEAVEAAHDEVEPVRVRQPCAGDHLRTRNSRRPEHHDPVVVRTRA